MILNHYWFIFKQKNLYKFLYEKLKVVVSLLQKVAQPIVLQNSIGKPIKQNLSLDANLLPASSVSIGFSGLSSLNTLRKLKWTLDATSINNFRKNGKVTITKIIILECSPFRSPWTLYMTALLPYQICPLSNEMQFSRFTNFWKHLRGYGGLQLNLLLMPQSSVSSSLKMLKLFIYGKLFYERIDDRYLKLLTKLPFFTGNLKDVSKKILILSHGNVFVESGFPV